MNCSRPRDRSPTSSLARLRTSGNSRSSADPDDFCAQIDQIGCALADDRRSAACRPDRRVGAGCCRQQVGYSLRSAAAARQGVAADGRPQRVPGAVVIASLGCIVGARRLRCPQGGRRWRRREAASADPAFGDRVRPGRLDVAEYGLDSGVGGTAPNAAVKFEQRSRIMKLTRPGASS